jgi:hypothetical protein
MQRFGVIGNAAVKKKVDPVVTSQTFSYCAFRWNKWLFGFDTTYSLSVLFFTTDVYTTDVFFTIEIRIEQVYHIFF